jgi:hypothetical protein
MARVNWSVNIESAFRGATRRRAVDSGKAGAWRKKALASIQIFGKDRIVTSRSFPGFAGHRPAFHGGFCVSRWAVLHGRRVPANLPVGRDLAIRRKIENGRFNALETRLQQPAGIIVLAVRKPSSNQGTTSRSTLKPPPRAPVGKRQKRGQPADRVGLTPAEASGMEARRAETASAPCPCTTARPAGDARQIAFEKTEPAGRIAGQVLRGERSQTENNHVSQTKQDDQRRRIGLVSEVDGGDALIW